MTRTELPILGWKEQVALPQLGIARLRAKLDTGARSSALHVENLQEIGHHVVEGDRLPVVRFDVLVGSRSAPRRQTVQVPVTSFKVVRDTGAKAERRPVVRTHVVCGPVDIEAEVTLTSRQGMNFRMLLGRLTLEGQCLVDPGHGYLHTPRPPRRKR